mgnify:CR=1 FL=1
MGWCCKLKALQAFVLSIVTSKWFILNWVVSILLVEFALSKLKPLYPKNKKDKERDEKYQAFQRKDLGKVNRFRLYLLAPTTLLRFTSGWVGIALCSLAIYIIGLLNIHKKGNANKGFGARLIEFLCSITARNVIFMMSGFHIEEIRPKVDYTKYLGPDWEPEYERPGSIVSNHQCWLDIMMHMYR